MRKVTKVIKKVFLVLLAVVVLFVAGAFAYHKVMLKKEASYWQNVPGQMVDVDGHKMHVYTEGEGDHTIVLMSAWGDGSPYVNFLPMCKELAKENKVVIVERFGYGFSDVVPGERDYDTILENDRTALKELGIDGPYVLCPHSISGLEATIWAQKYPEEVEAVVGMDISIADMKEEYEAQANSVILPVYKTFRAMGLTRFAHLGAHSKEEKMQHAIENKIEMNDNVISEMKQAVDACDEIAGKPLPSVPTIQFISKTASDAYPDEWVGGHGALVDASTNGKLIELNCDHYVYMFEQDRIVKEIGEFLKELD